LNGGKFCEVVYTVISGYLNSNFPSQPEKPRNMLVACQNLERIPANQNRVGDRSFRILISRMLPILYEVRNNRGVGHIGGDVDPNFMDASVVYSMASWIMAELVRVFHNVSTEQAQHIVDASVERVIPLVWESGDQKRVLNQKLNAKDSVMVLLYSTSDKIISVQDLFNWVEYKNTTNFKKVILQSLHIERYIEFDKINLTVQLSPKGILAAEEILIKTDF
jgi:hypothetical protein